MLRCRGQVEGGADWSLGALDRGKTVRKSASSVQPEEWERGIGE